MPNLATEVPAQTIESVRSMLGRLDSLKKKETESIPTLRGFVAGFVAALPDLQREEHKWRKATAPNFNVFRVLRLQRRETKLHSRFLAELFDPRASHGQGQRFLQAFLELAETIGLRRPSQWPANSVWRITTEEAVSESDRLDIVVRCAEAKFLTVIENKVDAAEGNEQLDRYDRWLQTQKAQAEFRNLIFLTPDGHEPETISADKCFCLSYRRDIRGWLRDLLEDIQAPSLRFAIHQYLDVIDSL